jgi:hypothetical protein
MSKNIDTVIDFTGGIPPYGQNVVIVALMLACYLGCSPIYFIGCDHGFTKIKKEEYEDYFSEHFYPEPKEGRYGMFSNTLDWEEYRRAMARMTYEYDQLKLYASRQGFQVFNATRGGCLDVFPRVEFESLFPRQDSAGSRGHPFGICTSDPLLLGKSAVKLFNDGDHLSSLALIDDALRHNINRRSRVKGLEYLMALCLASLDRHDDALMFARQDRECNPANRRNADVLIKQLENICAVQELIGL